MATVGAGTVKGVRSLADRTIRLTIDLQEMNPEQFQEIFMMIDTYVKFYMTTENVTQEAMDEIDSLEIETGKKSESQRMRNILYRLWEKEPEGYSDFNLYRIYKMQRINEWLKKKL